MMDAKRYTRPKESTLAEPCTPSAYDSVAYDYAPVKDDASSVAEEVNVANGTTAVMVFSAPPGGMIDPNGPMGASPVLTTGQVLVGHTGAAPTGSATPSLTSLTLTAAAGAADITLQPGGVGNSLSLNVPAAVQTSSVNANLYADGAHNTILGVGAGANWNGSADVTCFGYNAGHALGASATAQSTFFGSGAGAATTASPNSAFGYNALAANVTGVSNTALGRLAGSSQQAGFSTYVGGQAGANNNGANNTYVGYNTGETAAGTAATSTVVGANAQVGNAATGATGVGASCVAGGNYSLALGSQSTAPNNNAIALGSSASAIANGAIAIGAGAANAVANTCVIGPAGGSALTDISPGAASTCTLGGAFPFNGGFVNFPLVQIGNNLNAGQSGNVSASSVLSVAQVFGGSLWTSGAGAITLQMPTAANIIAALKTSAANQLNCSWPLRISNRAGFTVTIQQNQTGPDTNLTFNTNAGAASTSFTLQSNATAPAAGQGQGCIIIFSVTSATTVNGLVQFTQ
ncbi:MAG: hypothetical protein KGL39_01035 [Patescibacteria group bacterium]|nr:hypothetical protein [Patescibacteria group bacterium]